LYTSDGDLSPVILQQLYCAGGNGGNRIATRLQRVFRMFVQTFAENF